jgi:hypothetical protein
VSAPIVRKVLLVDRRRDEELVGNVVVEDRLARAHHASKALLGVELLGLEGAQARGHLELARIDVRDGDLFALALVVEQIDPAPVGDLRHRQPGDVAKRLLVVQRGG